MRHTLGGHGGGGFGCHARQCACLQGLAAWLGAVGVLAAAGREGSSWRLWGLWGDRGREQEDLTPITRAAKHQAAAAVERQQDMHLGAQRKGPGSGRGAVK